MRAQPCLASHWAVIHKHGKTLPRQGFRDQGRALENSFPDSKGRRESARKAVVRILHGRSLQG